MLSYYLLWAKETRSIIANLFNRVIKEKLSPLRDLVTLKYAMSRNVEMISQPEKSDAKNERPFLLNDGVGGRPIIIGQDNRIKTQPVYWTKESGGCLRG